MTISDPDHHDVFHGGKAGVLVTRRQSESVTQTDIDALLENAGLPTSKTPIDDSPTLPAPPLGTGFEPYEKHVDEQGYLRSPLSVSLALLNIPLW